MAAVDLMMAFGVRWAENGSLEVIDESQWRAGFAFIGATPPSVELFNKIQSINDEKTRWLYQQMSSVFQAAGETPTVGDLNSLRDSINLMVKNSFGIANNAAGWELSPSGKLMQWGAISSAAGASKSETFPIAFPNACHAVLLTGLNTTGNTQAYATLNTRSLGGFVWTGFIATSGSAPVMTPTAASVQGHFIAIGR